MELLPPTRKRKRMQETDIGMELVDRWSSPRHAEDESALRQIINTPLAEDEKIPITQVEFDRMVKFTTDRFEALHANDLAALFRVSEEDTAPLILRHVACRVVENRLLPLARGTDRSEFISFWEDLIGQTLRLVLQGFPIRHSDRSMSTGLLRPDFGYLMGGYCLFRGEERAPGLIREPIKELKDKIVDWSYGTLDYILGESHAYSELMKSKGAFSRLLRYRHNSHT